MSEHLQGTEAKPDEASSAPEESTQAVAQDSLPTPESAPEPTAEAGSTSEQASAAEAEAAADPESRPESETTPVPEATPEPAAYSEAGAVEPEATPTPESTPESATTPEAQATPVPEATPEPAVQADADAVEPHATPTPGVEPEAAPKLEETPAPEPEVTPTPEPKPESAPEGDTTAEPEGTPEPKPESAPEGDATAEPEATPEPKPESAPEGDATAEPEATPKPKPVKPSSIPSPAALAGRRTAVRPAVPAIPAPAATSESVKFGRVGEDGTVFVKDGEEERAVGSYPDASNDDALAYFARKYDELAANAQLLQQRLGQTDLSAHEAREALKILRDQIGEANVVGDLPALRDLVSQIEVSVKNRQRTETEQRAKAKAGATTTRETLVIEAETLAAADVHQVQWKSASARMRSMLDEWRGLQKKGPKLDKDVENALWHRLSAARSSFDKARKAFFSELDTEHAEAKRAKEKLVAEAEALAKNKDWGPTAGAFKRLMQDWRRAGRAQRADDDALWGRFKAAQDSFFDAKDEVVAAENEEFKANLVVKEALLVEAEALVPVKNLESTKSSLRTIQDRWDEAGKVPREDMSRVEGRLRKVEQAVRDLEDAKWSRTNPELNARAQSMVDQLERAVQGLEQDLEAAKSTGNDKKIAQAQAALDARREWLDSARGGVSEFGG